MMSWRVNTKEAERQPILLSFCPIGQWFCLLVVLDAGTAKERKVVDTTPRMRITSQKSNRTSVCVDLLGNVVDLTNEYLVTLIDPVEPFEFTERKWDSYINKEYEAFIKEQITDQCMTDH